MRLLAAVTDRIPPAQSGRIAVGGGRKEEPPACAVPEWRPIITIYRANERSCELGPEPVRLYAAASHGGRRS